jgi:hypothetical protein
MSARPAIPWTAIVVLAAAIVALPPAGTADAEKLRGSSKTDTLLGTKRADVLKGLGGNDRLKGRGGSDRIAGGGGKDKLVGGKGRDKLVAGRGKDVLSARDGVADRRVNGGPGKDRCTVDEADRAAIKGCEEIIGLDTEGGTDPGGEDPGGGQTGGGGGSPGGGDPGGGDPGGGAPGGGTPPPGNGPLTVTENTAASSCPGLGTRATATPCGFEFRGTGADATSGTVMPASNVDAVLASTFTFGPGAGEWEASGAYVCTAPDTPGALRVTIGTESIDVPVGCPPF